MAKKKLLMIVNPRAGRSRSRAPLYDAAAIFCGAGYLLDIRNTAAPLDATRIAAAEGAKYDAVVAVGGDGTLNEVISGLLTLSDPPPVGHLPRGSTNDFASSLHVPLDPVEAARAVVQSTPRFLDVGDFCSRTFVYVASFGAFTRTSYTASQDVKNALGHIGYFFEGVKDLQTLRPYRAKITADGETFEGEFLFGAVCNSTSIAGLMKLSDEDVVLDDGLFEMLLVPNPRTALDLQNVIFALLNQQFDREGIVFRHVSSIRVETDDDLPWALDGEYQPSRETVEIVNRQKALRFLL